MLIFVAKPPNASSLYKFLILFFAPQLIAFLTHGIMGLEVNKKVKRVDMLEGGLSNFMVIWKAYYHEIARHKEVPIVFILFVCSVCFVATEYAWFFIRSKGIIGVIVLLLIVALLAALRYYSQNIACRKWMGRNDDKRTR
jgi:hypothetical protein